MSTDAAADGPLTDGVMPDSAGSEATRAHPPMGSVGRGASVMAAGTLVSRLLGMVRNAMLAAAIGINGSAAAQAFDIANKIPNILYMLIAGGVLNAVLVPQIVRAYRTRRGDEYVDRVLTLGLATLAGLTVLLTAAASLLVGLYLKTDDAELRALAVSFAVWCIPQVFFYGAYSLLGQVLNARGSFGPYMWAPVVNNVVAIAGLGVFLGLFGHFVIGGPSADVDWWTAQRIALLAGTATLGVISQAVVLIFPLRRTGFRFHPRWGVRGVGLRTAGRVAGWTFAALAVGQVGYVAVSRVTSGATTAVAGTPEAVEVAGNAAYTQAFGLYMLPHSLVTVSLITALFTRLSSHAATSDRDSVRSDLSSGLRTLGLFTVFATAAMLVLAVPITRVVLPSMPAADIQSIARVLSAMVLGLAAFGAWSLCQRVYYAYEDARTLFWIQVVMAAVVGGLSLAGSAVLEPQWWTVNVGLAMSLSNVIGLVLALVGVRRILGRIGGAPVVRVHVQAVVAAAVAAGVGVGLSQLLGASPDATMARSLLVCAVVGAAMAAVYAGLLALMRVRELHDLVDPVLRRVRRRG